MQEYGRDIEITAGSGIHDGNIGELVRDTGVSEVHSSCRGWFPDPTAVCGTVSYDYAPEGHAGCTDQVAAEKVRALVNAAERI